MIENKGLTLTLIVGAMIENSLQNDEFDQYNRQQLTATRAVRPSSAGTIRRSTGPAVLKGNRETNASSIEKPAVRSHYMSRRDRR